MKYIHVYLDSEAWATLKERTEQWPEKSRTNAGICRYALKELHHDIHYYPDRALPSPMSTGDMHIQVRAHDAEEAALWAEMSERFSSNPDRQYTGMLRVALAHLSEQCS